MNTFKGGIKKFMFNLFRHASFIKWPDNGLLNVGIIYDETFTLQTWEESLRDNFGEYGKFCNIIFIKNKIHKYILAPGINIYFTGWLDKNYINLAQNLKWVYIASSGIEFLENVDTTGIKITTSGGICSKYVAEYVLTIIMMFLRRIDIAIVNQTKCKWEQKDILSRTRSIEAVTVGICGLGKNGQETANLCKKTGFRVVGFDKNDKTHLQSVDLFFDGANFENFIKASDFIVICLPLDKSTESLFSSKQFDVMKKDGCIINVSRAGIIDEKALRRWLNKNIIAAAATDVLPKEPCSMLYFLRKSKNLLVTPHIAGNINLISREIQADFINKLKNYVNQR